MLKSRKLQGYLLGVVGAASYGMNPLFALPLMHNGMATSSILFFRYLLAIPVMLVMMWMRGKSVAVTMRQFWLLAIFGTLMGLSSVCLFESYRYMDAGIASTLLFVYPLMVAVIMAVCFKERMSVVGIVSLVVALGGIALLYKGEGGATLSALGTILVMLSSLSYAVYIVGINRTQLSKVPTLTVTFWVLVFGLVVFAVYAAFTGGMQVASGWLEWGCIGGLAIFPTAISFLCTTIAIVYIGSTPTAILGAFEPVTAVFFGILVFGETLTGREVLGLIMIIVAVTMVIMGGSISRPLTAIRKLFPKSKKSH